MLVCVVVTPAPAESATPQISIEYVPIVVGEKEAPNIILSPGLNNDEFEEPLEVAVPVTLYVKFTSCGDVPSFLNIASIA
tara:strand:+ start:160 stop:399 length:240 start_codon:yes stop_codon:yes gene_type:complete